MQDAAGLLVVAGIDLVALEPGQGLEHAERQIGGDEQCHPGGDQRVPAEHGHEPRCAGRHHHPLGEIGVEDAQRTEILRAAVDDLLQTGVVRLHLGHPPPPLSEPLGWCGPRRLLAAPILRLEDGAVDDRCDLD